MYVLLRIYSYSRIVVVLHGALDNYEPTTIEDFEFQPIRKQEIGNISGISPP